MAGQQAWMLPLLLPKLLLGVQQAAAHTRNSDHRQMRQSGGAFGCTSRCKTAALPGLQYYGMHPGQHCAPAAR
jgi:hypothetical protein